MGNLVVSAFLLQSPICSRKVETRAQGSSAPDLAVSLTGARLPLENGFSCFVPWMCKLVCSIYTGRCKVEMSVSDLKNLLTVQQVAEMHDVPARVVRKAVKSGTIPGALEVLGRTGFDPDLVAGWTSPEPGTRAVGVKRPDGRQRFRIYLTPDEATKLLAEGYEVSDPREAAKARRAAKKEVQAEAGKIEPELTEGDDDPFSDFGA